MCIGEDQKVTEDTQLYNILKRQIFNDLQGIKEEALSQIIIAYTPYWTVGKTRASNAPRIHQVGQMIRNILEEFYPELIVAAMRIIYGGSVSPENAKLIVADDAIDGVLDGRFGSDPKRYAEVINVVEAVKIGLVSL